MPETDGSLSYASVAIDEAESDASLANRAQEGDPSAFRRLYERYAPVLAPRLTRVLRHRSDVEDVLQMTFLEAHRSLRKWDRRHAFGAWLHGIAFNVTGVFLRSRRRRWWNSVQAPREEESAMASTRSSEEEVIRRQIASRLASALDALDPKKRIAFVLHDIEGMGLTEMGELVGASPQTLFARVKSAREAIRRHFESRGWAS